MANTSISNLAAGAAVSATDLFANVQSIGAGPVKTTAAQIKTFTSASPTLVTPTLGVATATSINKYAFTAPATGATITLADGSTLATSGAYSVTLTATAATNITLPISGTLATTSNKLSDFAATTSAELAGVISDETGTGKLVFATSPTFTNVTTIEGTSSDPLLKVNATSTTACAIHWTRSGNLQGAIYTDNTGDMFVRQHTANILNFMTNGTTRLAISATGVVTIANLAGTGSRAVNADANGVLSAASDSSVKQLVAGAKLPGLTEILQITPRAYKWLSDIEIRGGDAATEVGFFADEVAPIIPSAAPKNADGTFGFYDRSVVAALVNAVKELKAEFDAYKASHP